MQVIYKPKRDSNYNLVPGQEVGFVVLLPDGYTKEKKYLLEIAIHGVGERSGGTLANLTNLVEGFDYDGNGTREGAGFVTLDMKKAVDQYGIIMVIPTYENNTFFEPDKINYLYDYAIANYNVHPKMLLTGFSYGGGATVKYITSSAENVARVAYAVPCAATTNIVDPILPGKAGLPVHAFHNDKDDRVSVSSTKNIITRLNEKNTGLKALMTIFRKDGHGGNIEAWSLTPPKAPGGEGFTDAAENIYQVFTDIVASGPRQMKSGTVALPLPEPEPPATTLEARVSYTIEGSKIHLIGDKSIGYKSGSEGKWEFVSAPEGVTKYQVFPGGSTYINADGVLPKPGTYVFRFQLKDLSPLEVVVKYGEAVKLPAGFDSTTDLITYSDGTTEKGTAVFSGGKWIVKTASGQIINL